MIPLLVSTRVLPYTQEAKDVFDTRKKTIEESVVCSIDESVKF